MLLESSPEKASVNYRLLRIATEKYGKAPAALDAKDYAEVRSIAAREFLIEQAVLGSAEAADVVVPGSQVDKAVEQICARYGDENAFYAELASNQLRLEDLKHALERELRVEAVLGLVGSRAARVGDTEINLFYYLNRERFSREEQRTVRHILLTINPQFAENTREATLRRAGQILKRLRKHPGRFADQAMKHSECPTSLQGGLLGEVKRDSLYPELGAVLFGLRKGQISDLVESPVGIHILLCEAIQPGGVAPLADIRESLTEKMQERERSRHTRRWVRELLSAKGETVETPTEEYA
ncbi:nitrogen fixation protein NifM [Haliea sp. E17]|uniref:nitrogen fixation protein NifM n=1 Tax=Haliea sp. E17 TaxID=3401576 RepID=UPI003AAC18F8